MKTSPNTIRIGIAVAVVVGTIGWLAWSGMGANESYYKNIPELAAMGDKAYQSHVKLHGFVQPGSIEHNGPHVTFVMNEFESHSPKAPGGRLLTVEYKGSEPPPDTFKDDSEAIADGTYGRDGVFHATVLQAKCASKYAPAQPGAQPGTAPAQPAAAPNNNPRAATVPESKPAS